ncbi:MAG: RagB/SusD family nutrient uptake outer membrane protein [Rikenellaceae bacterium]
MKKIIYSFLALALLLTTAGCADMLDLKSPDQLTEDKFYRDEKDALSSLAYAYAQVDGPDSWAYAEVKFPVEEYHTDLVETGSDVANYIDWQQLFNLTNTNANTQTGSYWERAYLGILCANQTIAGTKRVPEGKIDEGVRKNIISEARFLRAYYHLVLQMNWRQIIIRDVPTVASNIDKNLATRAESWKFIIDELNDCADGLLDAQPASQAGRVTKNAAYAYLGFALVNKAYETETGDYVASPNATTLAEAITALDKVTGVSLNSNFISMFDGTGENSSESIFERQFSASTDNGFWVITRHHQWLRTAPLGGWDEIRPSQFAYDQLTKEKNGAEYDKRAYATMLFSCDYYNDPATFPYTKGKNDTFDKVFAKETRTPVSSFRKYLPSTRAELDMDILGTNVPLMRYANVLLLKAEALAQTGRGAEAIAIVDNIRSVHGGMPATTEKDAMKAIEHERIMEFTLENSRFFDLRRWGKLSNLDIMSEDKTTIVRKFDPSKNLYFPIPVKETNSNTAIK